MNTYSPLLDLGPLFFDAMAAARALPTPLDVLTLAVLAVLWVPVWVFVTATLNVSTLGVWWPVGYWLVVVGLWSVASAGVATDVKVFAGGEDVAAYGAGGRASWLGAAAKVTRLRVRLRATTAATQIVVGYGGAAALIAIGVLWEWLAVAAAVGLAVWYRRTLAPRWWIDEG